MQLTKAPKQYYSEIHQDKQISFSFVNRKADVLTEMFSPILCRDFLNDVLISEYTKKKCNIYNFSYNPEKQQIDRDKLRLLLYVNKKDYKNIENNISIIRAIEKENKLTLTKLYKVEEDIYLLEANKYWLKSTFLLSFYTLMIRVMSYKFDNIEYFVEEMKEINTNEGRYIKDIYPNLNKFLDSFKKVFKGKPHVVGYDMEAENMYFYHDYNGITSLLGKSLDNFKKVADNKYRKAILSHG